jgi:D-serine deaminase-like pyridoxal phosphate-dependent protein
MTSSSSARAAKEPLKALSSDRPASGGSSCGVVLTAGDVEFNTTNEEHGRLTGPGAEELMVGDVVAVVPNHACGTVNMWSSLLVADGGAIVDEWKIVARHGGPS